MRAGRTTVERRGKALTRLLPWKRCPKILSVLKYREISVKKVVQFLQKKNSLGLPSSD